MNNEEKIKQLFEEFYQQINLPIPQWEELATPQQKRLFFLKLKQNHIDNQIGRMRAKMKYNLLSFNHITKSQLSVLIDALELYEKRT